MDLLNIYFKKGKDNSVQIKQNCIFKRLINTVQFLIKKQESCMYKLPAHQSYKTTFSSFSHRHSASNYCF